MTIKHLLTHTAGLTTTLTGIASAAEYVADICASPATPGRCAYNSIAMWLIAEIVQPASADAPSTTSSATRSSPRPA